MRVRAAVAIAVAIGSIGVPAGASPYQGAPYLWIMDADGSNSHALVENVRPSSFDVNPDSGDVVYAATNFGTTDIWVAPLDGSEPLNLTASEHWERSPVWNPDGDEIAFVREGGPDKTREHSDDLVITSADGSGEEIVAYLPFDLDMGAPAWSPGGEQIAFVAYAPEANTGRLMVVDADGSDLEVLVDDGVAAQLPSWSPDSDTIAFETRDRDIKTIPVVGGDVSDLTDQIYPKLNPQWSPNGNTIAFDSVNGLHTIDAGGSDLQTLGDGMVPRWSEDGSRIVFERHQAIATIDPDGSDMVLLTETGESYEDDEYRPQFTPDEEQIVFLKGIWQGVPQGSRTADRSLRYRIEDHSWFVGRARSDFTECLRGAAIRVQRKLPNKEWKSIVRYKTGRGGRFRFPIPDRTGRYRATMPGFTLNYGFTIHCPEVTGPVIRHIHR